MQIFREYDTINEEDRPRGEKDRIDAWIIRFSKTVQHNLIPLFEFWGFAIRAGVTEALEGLPRYLPDDEITRGYGANQTAIILEKYPDVIREPMQLPEIEIPGEPTVMESRGKAVQPNEEEDEEWIRKQKGISL